MAKRGNKNAVGNSGGGRKSKYEASYAGIAERVCLNGATVAELAITFGVTMSTIYSWQAEHPEFAAAVKVGKGAVDESIKLSFAMRARGYDYTTEKLIVVNDKIERVEIIQHVPPDVAAGKFWLINRCPTEFRTVPKVVEEAARENVFAKFLRDLKVRRFEPVQLHGPEATKGEQEPDGATTEEP